MREEKNGENGIKKREYKIERERRIKEGKKKQETGR